MRSRQTMVMVVTAVLVGGGLGACSTGGVRSGVRVLADYATGFGSTARASADDLSSAGIRSQVDELLADAAVVSARNDEVAAIRSTSQGDEAFVATCNISVDWVYPSVDDPADPAFDEISAAAQRLLTATQSELPNGAMRAWAERIVQLGTLAYGESDQKEVAALKLARDGAVFGLQQTFCR